MAENRLHMDRDERSPQTPTDGAEVDNRRWRQGVLKNRWNKGAIGGGGSTQEPAAAVAVAS
jgi:hypothetical protein